jgi:rhomboid protease GluP
MAAIQPVEDDPPEPDADDEKKAKAEEDAFEHALVQDVPDIYVTPAIIAINVVVFCVMTSNGLDPTGASLLRWGANYGPLTHLQWWRLLTSTFLHAGVPHIALNMWALWASGRIVERLYGAAWFLALYLVCGVGASLVALWSHPAIPSVGASGAIVGVYGCLLAFMMHPNESLSAAARKTEINSLAAFFACLFVSGFTDSGIDTAAHVGGAVLGFLVGYAYATWLEPRMPSALEITLTREQDAAR